VLPNSRYLQIGQADLAVDCDTTRKWSWPSTHQILLKLVVNFWRKLTMAACTTVHESLWSVGWGRDFFDRVYMLLIRDNSAQHGNFVSKPFGQKQQFINCSIQVSIKL